MLGASPAHVNMRVPELACFSLTNLSLVAGVILCWQNAIERGRYSSAPKRSKEAEVRETVVGA